MKSKDKIAKKEIIQKAQQLFKKYGLKKTTMDEIAEACGKAKSTLYHYFKNKEQIFDEVVHAELTALRVIVKDKVESKKTISEKLSTYFLEFHQEIISKANLYSGVKNELKNEKKSAEIFHHLLVFETGFITRILEDGFESEEFSEINVEDIPWFAEAVLAAFFGIVRFSIENEDGFEVKKMERIINTFIPKLFG